MSNPKTQSCDLQMHKLKHLAALDSSRFHVGQFESLRGLAAAWVFLGHAMVIAECSAWPLDDGGLAVDLFVILSGFVITLLVQRRVEPYSIYLLRRFARLYPLYLIALALGFYTQHLAPHVIGQELFGLPSPPSFSWIVPPRDVPTNLFLHVTMLHGLIPDTVIPNASTAFSGPLWSISLEWQFYIVAPAMIWALDYRQPRRWPFAVACALLIGIGWVLSSRLWSAQVPAFLPLRLPFFALGILSGIFWKQGRASSTWAVAAPWICLTAAASAARRDDAIPLAIWGLTFTAAYAKTGDGPVRWVNGILQSSVLRRLGEVSYGVYILHLPLLLLFGSTVVIPEVVRFGQAATLGALLLIFPLVVVVSGLLHRLVEQPAMRWAKVWTSRAKNAD